MTTSITRQEAIDRLVDDCVENAFDHECLADYLAHLFRSGITGFSQMSDEELETEIFDAFGDEVTI